VSVTSFPFSEEHNISLNADMFESSTCYKKGDFRIIYSGNGDSLATIWKQER
jgi:hypothetical protein